MWHPTKQLVKLHFEDFYLVAFSKSGMFSEDFDIRIVHVAQTLAEL